MTPSHQPPGFAALVRDFFCERLLNQQNVSPHTVTSYRDAFRLFLAFVQRRKPGRMVSRDGLRDQGMTPP